LSQPSAGCITETVDEEVSGTDVGRETLPPVVRGSCFELFRVLYLFSGCKREGSLCEGLRKEASKRNKGMQVVEMDVLNCNCQHNLLKKSVRAKVEKEVADWGFDAVVASPPCSAFSRARWANPEGPRPLRSAGHPRGFQHLSGGRQKQVDDANLLVDFTVKMLDLQKKLGGLILWSTQKI
jgi:hypothetical protein